MNNVDKIFEFTKISENLKLTERWLDTPTMARKETSAEHSWHLALLAFIVARELNLDIDIEKSILIATIHDLAESIAGDVDNALIVTNKVTVKEKNAKELAAMERIVATLPSKTNQEIMTVWQEYENCNTREAKYIKALDKIEAINHMLVIGPQSFDLPDPIAKHADKAVAEFTELAPMLRSLKKRLKPAYQELGWEWKEEYNFALQD